MLRSPRWDNRRWDIVVLLSGALAVRLPAFFASRSLVFDEGVYASSAVAMRDGELPFRQVFSAQGPLHLPLVYAFDLLGGRTLDSPRLVSVAAGLVVTFAVYAIGRRIGTRQSALLAAALVATTGSILWTTAPLTGDGPAAALTALAVLGAIAWRDAPSSWRAILTGVAMGAALAVKALAAVAAIPIGLVFLLAHRARRVRDLAAAVAAAVGVLVVVTVPWGVSRVIDQSITYHTDAPRLESIGEQFNKLVSTLPNRDLALIVAVVLGFVATAIAARSGRGRSGRPVSFAARRDTLILLAWLVPLIVVLVFEKNMWRPHIAAVTLPLALLVAVRPPPFKWFAIALVALVPWWAVHLGDIVWPQPYHGAEAAVVADMRALPKGAWVISDEPGLVWRAGRRSPAALVDGSVLRVLEHIVTTPMLAKEAGNPRVCAVVVWSSRYGRDLPGLDRALRDDGFAIAHRYGGVRTFWLKRPRSHASHCRP
jgi:4-amino-4-deoxy-L-arabinose transferase-like glycosyltransferase